MNKKLSELQREAYEGGLRVAIGCLEIIPEYNKAYSLENIKKCREEIIRELDKIFTGSESYETLEKLIFAEGGATFNEGDGSAAENFVNNTINFVGPLVLDNWFFSQEEYKGKITDDGSYEPFVKFLIKYCQIKYWKE